MIDCCVALVSSKESQCVWTKYKTYLEMHISSMKGENFFHSLPVWQVLNLESRFSRLTLASVGFICLEGRFFRQTTKV